MVENPRFGIHGPHSTAWRYNREVLNFVAGGRAALLQLAHPYVAHGVDQHSRTRTDARGRFQRTFDYIFSMTFGPLDDAMTAARRVHNIHTRVRGTIDEDVGRFARGHEYRANDPESLMWVFATLVEGVVCVNRTVGRPISRRDLDTYYADSKRFALLFGIPDDVVPPDWPAFCDYFERMIESDTLAVGRPAREIGAFLFQTTSSSAQLVFDLYRIVTAGLMPARFREPFGLPFGPAERAIFGLAMPAIRAGMRLVPAPFRFVPGYIRALERVGLAPSSRYGAVADRLALGGVNLWPLRLVTKAA